MAEWIGELRFSQPVVAKLREKHNLTVEQVNEAIAFGAHDKAVWDNDSERGIRLVVTGTTSDGIALIAYLRPIDRADGLWRCLTAFRME
jgi:hypothetical protein